MQPVAFKKSKITSSQRKINRRRFLAFSSVSAVGLLGLAGLSRGNYGTLVESAGGWVKVTESPVLGGAYGTCFDLTLLKEANLYRMWFSWRPKLSIGYSESFDGVNWSPPVIALSPDIKLGWQDEINRPVVLKKDGFYQMWYTGQAGGNSLIGYAISSDGKSWQTPYSQPVLKADQEWEHTAVMCPSVLWDEPTRQYQMWYSGGEQYEPDAIGFAASLDGITWTKNTANPIFKANPLNTWESYKVTACQVTRYKEWYLMFYIGFKDVHQAQIGVARSRDGITNWQRLASNPIIRPAINANGWDHDAVYKPYALLENNRWLLWYNGRRSSFEQIGLASHAGEDLGFEQK